MGLFSDLLGKAAAGELVKAVDKVAKEVGSAVNDAAKSAGIDLKGAAEKAKAAEAERAARGGAASAAACVQNEDGPSGFSWGPNMPAEENQYNYNGTFTQYFEHVFAEDFPGYQVQGEKGYGGNSVVYTFLEGGRKALVVELLSRRSDSKKLRQNCRLQGIPYLRFYYDYDGWWNTRAYVDDRISKALSR